MRGMAIGQRCWNHELREAVCRCPGCGRSFCRECVTEHEARLLCAGGLRAVSARAEMRGGISRKLGPFWMAAAGLLLAWLFFYAAGQGMILVAGRLEQTAWQRR